MPRRYGNLPKQVTTVHGSPGSGVLGSKVVQQQGRDRVLGVGVCCYAAAGAGGSGAGSSGAAAVSGLVFHIASDRFGITQTYNISVASSGGSACRPADAQAFVAAPPGNVLTALRTASDGTAVYGVGFVWMRDLSGGCVDLMRAVGGWRGAGSGHQHATCQTAAT